VIGLLMAMYTMSYPRNNQARIGSKRVIGLLMAMYTMSYPRNNQARIGRKSLSPSRAAAVTSSKDATS
jgi:hypothetical protein